MSAATPSRAGAAALAAWLGLAALPVFAAGQESHEGGDPDGARVENHSPGRPEYDSERPQHLSLLFGNTDEDGEDGFTLGLDYEYRLNTRWGLGLVAEYAGDELRATTLLAVADLHLWRGLAVQIGPGIEIIDRPSDHPGPHGGQGPHGPRGGREELFAFRVGALYEVELGRRWTVSPQLHYDFIPDGETDAVVACIAFGVFF